MITAIFYPEFCRQIHGYLQCRAIQAEYPGSYSLDDSEPDRVPIIVSPGGSGSRTKMLPLLEEWQAND
jgi:hypothetical protein